MNLISQIDLPGGVSEGEACSSEDTQLCGFKVGARRALPLLFRTCLL
jgi:hypothetical protein